MATRRKAHPDHYHTNPPPPQDAELHRKEHRPQPGPERPGRPEPHAEGQVRAGDKARHAVALHCARCDSRIAVLADQHVPVCPHCGGKLYRAAG